MMTLAYVVHAGDPQFGHREEPPVLAASPRLSYGSSPTSTCGSRQMAASPRSSRRTSSFARASMAMLGRRANAEPFLFAQAGGAAHGLSRREVIKRCATCRRTARAGAHEVVRPGLWGGSGVSRMLRRMPLRRPLPLGPSEVTRDLRGPHRYIDYCGRAQPANWDEAKPETLARSLLVPLTGLSLAPARARSGSTHSRW